MYSFSKIKIKSIVSCVPNEVLLNEELNLEKGEIEKIIGNTGINKRRITNSNTTASDLCLFAADALMKKNNILANEIDALIFVTQYPDYILPSTAHILKDKLCLRKDILAIQINEGCSAYGYGLLTASNLFQNGSINNVLLLCGDTPSKLIDQNDLSTLALFSDGGSASLIQRGNGQINIEVGSDGSGYKDIISEGGGFRNFELQPKLYMDGMNVFVFGINFIPKVIIDFLNKTNTSPLDYDYIVLHQANKMMNERIVRKLNFDEKQALTSIEEYGNTSSASIPITICHSNYQLELNNKKFLCCGFGVGLSWAVFSFELNSETLLDFVYY